MQKQWIMIWSVASVIVAGIVFSPYLFITYQLETGNWVLVKHNVPFMEAHQLGVNTFVRNEGFGFGRFREPDLWNAVSLNFEGKEYHYDSIHLIGLTPEQGQRYFDRNYPPLKDAISSEYARPLKPDEAKAVAPLLTGTKPYVTLPGPSNMPSAIRVIAPLLRQEECRKCHPGPAGGVLGAFDYLLTPSRSPVVSTPP